MDRIRFASTAVLLLLLGITAPVCAQQQKGRDKQDRQQQQEQGKQQPRAQQQQQDRNKQQPRAQQQQQDRNKQQPRAQQQQQDRNKQQPRAQQQQRVNRPSQQSRRLQRGEDRAAWQQHRARSWQAEHKTWRQRGGYNGYRIPENNFRGNFGQNHGFRIYSLPLMIAGEYLRFQYSGFWFSVVDPWPEYWPDNWYENDDVFIDYSGDGYYMYNRRYPRDRIAISVYVN
jgi:hypothetical protein